MSIYLSTIPSETWGHVEGTGDPPSAPLRTVTSLHPGHSCKPEHGGVSASLIYKQKSIFALWIQLFWVRGQYFTLCIIPSS